MREIAVRRVIRPSEIGVLTRKFLLLLVPLALFAQVEIDTVMRVPTHVANGCFLPELNKLYVLGVYQHYALDCSTYQLRAQIPRSHYEGIGSYSWNWRRQKLYVGVNPYPDSLAVIDAVADTLMRMIPRCGLASAYVGSTDRLYRGVDHDLVAIDCATDTVVRTIPPPESAYVFSAPSWDPVGNKLYVTLGSWELQSKIAVYDCASDSLLALIDVPGTGGGAGVMNFDQTYRKAYFASASPWAIFAGVIDTRSDTLIKLFSFPACSEFNPVAVDTRDHKAYIAGRDTISGITVEALYVIDCATDSVVKELTWPLKPWSTDLVRWAPWSNRVYLTRTSGQVGLGIKVVDCNTDSIIVPDMSLGYWSPFDLQIDPIRERVFAIGAESTTVHVLRDVMGGVAETTAADSTPGAPFRVRELRDAVELEYHLETPGWVEVAVFDPCGRRIKTLASERQMPGRHDLKWDRTDMHETKVARGAYFVVITGCSERHALKTVVR